MVLLNSSPPALDGERRVVTMLFCDVDRSSVLAQRLDPEDWAELMNTAFGYLTRPVLRYEGIVARLMGDGFLAFFGAPIAHEDDPVRSVLAGLDIVEGLHSFRKQVARDYDLDFNIRIGIHTGPVVVGEVGQVDAGSFTPAGEYTVMGDAANLAARMEQTAEPGTVHISEHTYELVRPYFDCEEDAPVPLKNQDAEVRSYRVLGRKEIPGRARGIAGLESPLVGRDAEFARTEAALAELLTQRRGGIVGLIGEAGLGKSRLLEELHRQAKLAGLSPTSWIESRGISYDMARPYGLFVQHLRQIHTVRSEDSPGVARQKVTDFFENLEPDQLESFFQLADLLLELRTGSNGDSPSDQEAVKRQIFEASLHFWERLSLKNPVVLVFDDLHWADPASVDLLLHLFQLVDRVPVLFLCAFRPYRKSAAWRVKTGAETDYPHRYQEIQLRPLSEADSGKLVDNLLAIAELPPRLKASMLQKAEGNPFFIEEVVRTLIERGLLRRDPSGLRWLASGASQEIGVPDNLQTMLLARIDRLETGARRSLQQASVIGRTFQKPVLQAIAEQVDQLDQQLVELQRAELIREAARIPEAEYMFHHELIRDAAYESILKRQRREYHLRTAQAIERLYPDHLLQEAHRLAYHYAQAREPEKALKYYSLAGDFAARLSANEEACDHYEQAIQLARRLEAPGPALASLYTRRGRILELLNDYDPALENYEELRKLGEARNDRSLELAALIAQGTIYSTLTSKFDPVRGMSLGRRALELALKLDDKRAEARALWNLMLIESFGVGDTHQAISYGKAALAIAREHGLREELAFVLHDIARPYAILGRWEEARQANQEALQLWRELDNKPMQSDNLTMLAEIQYQSGEYIEAARSAGQAMQISEETGNAWGKAYSRYILIPVLLEQGEIDQALEMFEQAYRLSVEANFVAGMFGPPSLLAWLFAQLGDLERARQSAQSGEELLEQYPTFRSLGSLTRIFLALVEGRFQTAWEIWQSLEEADLAAISEIFFGPFIHVLEVEVLLGVDKPQEALDRAENLQQRMQASGVRLVLPDLLRSKAHALLALGRGEEAWQELAAAREIARQQVSRRSLWPVLADLVRQAPDPQAAAAYRQEGQEVVDFIAGHISDESLRGKFLALPDVKELER